MANMFCCSENTPLDTYNKFKEEPKPPAPKIDKSADWGARESKNKNVDKDALNWDINDENGYIPDLGNIDEDEVSVKANNHYHFGTSLESEDDDKLEVLYPHHVCNDYINDHREYDVLPSCDKMQIQSFRTCRQVYSDANKAFWANTIFSFNDPLHFSLFIAARTAYQKTSLRKLHLEMKFLYREDVRKWNKALPNSLIKTLVGLRALHLYVQHSSDDLPVGFAERARHFIYANILGLQILPLTDVTVVWHKFYDEYDNFEDWP